MRSGDFHNKAKSASKAAHKDSDQKQKNLSEEKKKREGGRWFWFFLVILVLTALSYANSLQNQYVFDDLHLITARSQLTGVETIPRLLLSGKVWHTIGRLEPFLIPWIIPSIKSSGTSLLTSNGLTGGLFLLGITFPIFSIISLPLYWYIW